MAGARTSHVHARRRVLVAAVVLAVALATVAPVAAAGLDDNTDDGVGETLHSNASTGDSPDAGGTNSSTTDGDSAGTNGTDSGSSDPGWSKSNSTDSNESSDGSPETNRSDGSGGGNASDAGSTETDSSASNDSTDGWSNGSDNATVTAVGTSVGSVGETDVTTEVLDSYGLPTAPVETVTGLTQGETPDGANASDAGDPTDATDDAVDAVGSAVEEVVALADAGDLLDSPFGGSGGAGPSTAGSDGARQSSDGGPAAGSDAGGDRLAFVPSTGTDAGLPASGPVSAGAAVGLGAVAAAAAARSGALPGASASLGAALTGALAPVSVRGAGALDRLTRLFAPLRYSRYDDSDPLEHEAREEVFRVVEERPGAYLSEVAERAGLPLSTTRHHVRVLEREDLVSGAKVRGKRRFYPAHTSGIELTAAMNDEATAAVLDAIARLGAASVSDLADELSRDPSTISHHLQRLADDGIIVRERDGRAVMNKLAPDARTALEPGAAVEERRTEEAVVGSAD